MSNLKLKSMHYKKLKDRLRDKNGKPEKLGYETWATDRTEDDAVAIQHHASIIGIVKPFSVSVSNRGWDSSTTRDRINRILRDNGIPFGVTQKNGEQLLVDDNLKKVASFIGWFEFRMEAGLWVLV